MKRPACKAWHQAALGLVLLAVLALPVARHGLESSMWRHMLLQFPLWMLAGALLAAMLPRRLRSGLAPWNAPRAVEAAPPSVKVLSPAGGAAPRWP